MERIDISVDITQGMSRDITEGQQLSISVWAFIPSVEAMLTRPVVVSLLHGGSYDKRYFHVQVPGRDNYSVAEYLCKLGYIVVLSDMLGVGESSRAPTQMKATRQVVAQANHLAVQEIFSRITTGTLCKTLPALSDFLKVGGGHSMGGFQIITQQASHRTYDRLMVVGYSAAGVQLNIDGEVINVDPGELDLTEQDYHVTDRSYYRKVFHWDDVPSDVLEIDDSLSTEVPYVIRNQSMMKGIVAEDAAKIDVPLFLCFGERDVSPNPHAEPSCYPRSNDVTLQILSASAHCQTFAGTRLQLLDRIDKWIQSIPQSHPSL